MTYTKHLIMVVMLGMILTGCASPKDTVESDSPEVIYTTAQQRLQDGKFRAAIKLLEALDNRYPFGPYAQQVQLDLIYAYYKNHDLPLAQATIDRFTRLNPTHPNIDYALYIKGLTDMALDSPMLFSLFGIDHATRDPVYARLAFQDFDQLLRRYPDSQYANDASKRMIALKNRLAKYELAVAQFYFKRSAYVAVINRVENLLSAFSDTQATRTALPLMEKSYRHLGLNSEAEKVAQIIAVNRQ